MDHQNKLHDCYFKDNVSGFLGTAFIPIKNDITGNVSKVRTKYESGKNKCKYIEDLIEDDLAKNNGKMGTATEGLLWLKRSGQFLFRLIQEYESYFSTLIKSNYLFKLWILASSKRN